MWFTLPQEIWQKDSWSKRFDEVFSYVSSNGICGLDGKEVCNRYCRYLTENEVDPMYIWCVF